MRSGRYGNRTQDLAILGPMCIPLDQAGLLWDSSAMDRFGGVCAGDYIAVGCLGRHTRERPGLPLKATAGEVGLAAATSRDPRSRPYRTVDPFAPPPISNKNPRLQCYDLPLRAWGLVAVGSRRRSIDTARGLSTGLARHCSPRAPAVAIQIGIREIWLRAVYLRRPDSRTRSREPLVPCRSPRGD